MALYINIEMDIPQLIAQELSLGLKHVQNALVLFAEGGTVPFIARYRKERTGEMNEVQLRALLERHTYLAELEERKATILRSIDSWSDLPAQAFFVSRPFCSL